MAAPAPQLTTEAIQQMLEDNFTYIKAIVDQQDLGRLDAMAHYQAKLQVNLLQLAALADAQPAPGTAVGAAGPSVAPSPAPAPSVQLQGHAAH
mmetsp:Transcript_9312/g.16473  ORF Transcript_9312/g.16473 Transcript_9312/m.16473 type:complete len:93 (-) Transcript_9312:44-322(-)|eukprot:CAMPEP_0119105116 /NCGR_PEP_ID=MMETSP1180-20130426/3172_1 /TAXON_ID=3052 ORGANISM="Chlamydomonas cf sp, Strain CCMP681" /NCGR_SAMPLE_ID=MMETSP1180 /ASSEMBLY_ACC=CAM_ASM_000741 /LENGTH=92 /DNA_ID=CAMNT_0007090093 /DNA_START=151 /DNA_END=429 /DNA_ORIENTATION=+